MSTGAVSLPAAAHAAAPTFFSAEARRAAVSAVADASAVAGVGVADGATDGLVLGAGALATSPPPWPPAEDDALGAALPVAAGALLVPFDGAALLPADGAGLAAAGCNAASATSPVAPITRRKRICAACDRSLSWSLASPASETTIVLLPWMTTSASETPSALTRCSMIPRACSILCFDGAWPPCTEAM